MKRSFTAAVCVLLAALLLPLCGFAAPMITCPFQFTADLLNSAQGDDGSYTQMYRQDDVSILCAREETYYDLEAAFLEKVSNWYSDVETPDAVADCEIDGMDAKHARLTLPRGAEPKQADLFCLIDHDWLLCLEFTYPAKSAETVVPMIESWVASVNIVDGNIDATDLNWEEVRVYTEFISTDSFPTLGELNEWAGADSFSWKHTDEGVAVTLNVTGGMITVLAQGAENIFTDDAMESKKLPEGAAALPYSLSQLVWTSPDFTFDAPRSFYPGTDIQTLLDSFPDSMIEMVSNSRYGFTQCIEVSAKNPDDKQQKVSLAFYGAETSVGQVVLDFDI